jgi:hypothetical protein
MSWMQSAPFILKSPADRSSPGVCVPTNALIAEYEGSGRQNWGLVGVSCFSRKPCNCEVRSRCHDAMGSDLVIPLIAPTGTTPASCPGDTMIRPPAACLPGTGVLTERQSRP